MNAFPTSPAKRREGDRSPSAAKSEGWRGQAARQYVVDEACPLHHPLCGGPSPQQAAGVRMAAKSLAATELTPPTMLRMGEVGWLFYSAASAVGTTLGPSSALVTKRASFFFSHFSRSSKIS